MTPAEGADPLALFDPEARRQVCHVLVAGVADNAPRLAAATKTEPQLNWLLATMGHCLTLPVNAGSGPNNDAMSKALGMCVRWLRDGLTGVGRRSAAVLRQSRSHAAPDLE